MLARESRHRARARRSARRARAQRTRGDLRSQPHRRGLLRAHARERRGRSGRARIARSAASAKRRSRRSRSATRPTRWDGLVDELERERRRSRARGEGRAGEGRAARLLRFLPRSADGADVRDDRRSRSRSAAARSATASRSISTRRRRRSTPKAPSLRAQRRAPRRADAIGRSIVVEGYLDCIALHQAGFENAVAALGTAFTPRAGDRAAQIRRVRLPLLRRRRRRKRRCNQSRSISRLSASSTPGRRSGSSCCRPARIPTVSCATRGAEAFRALLDDAKPAIEFSIDPQIDALARPVSIARRRSRAKAEALIRELTPREEWDRWRVYVAGRLQVNADDLRNSRFLANSANFAPRIGRGQSSIRQLAAYGRRCEPLSFEREVVEHSARGAGARSRSTATASAAARFRNELYRRIYERIVEHARELVTNRPMCSHCFARTKRASTRWRRSGSARPQFDGALRRLRRAARASRPGRRAVAARRASRRGTGSCRARSTKPT